MVQWRNWITHESQCKVSYYIITLTPFRFRLRHTCPVHVFRRRHRVIVKIWVGQVVLLTFYMLDFFLPLLIFGLLMTNDVTMLMEKRKRNSVKQLSWLVNIHKVEFWTGQDFCHSLRLADLEPSRRKNSHLHWFRNLWKLKRKFSPCTSMRPFPYL